MRFIVSVLTLCLSTSVFAAAGDLFHDGKAEAFQLKDEKGKDPSYRVLHDSAAKQALAAAIAGALNAQPETQPKIPVQGFIDVNLQQFIFTPHPKNTEYLKMAVRLNGHNLELPKLVKRDELLKGKPQEMDFPSEERNIAIFSIRSGGKAKFHFDKQKKELIVTSADAKMDFDSPLVGDGSEAIRFVGRGVRVK